MLFLSLSRPIEGPRSTPGRPLSFDLPNGEPGIAPYFCKRHAAHVYEEATEAPFLARLGTARQALLYLHDGGRRPEEGAFREAAILQRALAEDGVRVVPVLWPCREGSPGAGDEPLLAAQGGLALARALARLGADDARPTAVLAHGMGARVLQEALRRSGVPRLDAAFLAAPALPDDALEAGGPLAAARRLVLYHAAADAVLAGLGDEAALGRTGPALVDLLPERAAAVDAGAVAAGCDPKAHAYHLPDGAGRPGPVLAHLQAALRTGDIPGTRPWQRRVRLAPGVEAYA
ncbi:MAG: hypothetical protein KDG89_16380 [Geminicoccaceae bacterium]|nr:hypothetical protein [Geminicoccaceae bacterium]